MSADERGGARRGLPEEGSAQTSVALRVFTAERPATLRDALDHDHRAALANTVGLVSLSVRTVVSDEADDYQGRPSWFVRVRSEIPSYADGLCSATEYSVREVLVEHGGKTYLAQVQGVYSWKLAQAERDESDPGSADAVADRVANGLDIEHAR